PYLTAGPPSTTPSPAWSLRFSLRDPIHIPFFLCACQLFAGHQYARLSLARNRPAERYASPCDAHAIFRSSPIDPLLGGKVSLGRTKARARQPLRLHLKRKQTRPCLAHKQPRRPRKSRSR